MKIKSGLILRHVANQFVIVPTGKRTREVQRMIYISVSAAFLWENFKDKEFTADDMVDLIMTTFTGVTRDVAAADVDQFLAVLKRNCVLEPEPGEPEAVGGSVRIRLKHEPK